LNQSIAFKYTDSNLKETSMRQIDLKGKKAFIVGISDDQGYGWAIAKALAEAGAQIIIGSWVPVVRIFTQSWSMGKFDASRQLSNGQLMQYAKVYPIDATLDRPEDIPQEIRTHKRYADQSRYTVSEVAEDFLRDFGSIDILVHSLANAPEVKKPLLETSRQGYLAASSSSSYSLISLLSHFHPHFNPGGSVLSLTYIASERVIPGYGGGMSSAKAALESDTRTLAWEMGQRCGVRVNTISAGPYGSRAAKAIGFIEKMIAYSENNAPLRRPLKGEDVGYAALFLLSPWAEAITGTTLYVDNGLNIMGLASDSPSFHS
jgi:enoyl-[acyl-carrier protein] reductase I